MDKLKSKRRTKKGSKKTEKYVNSITDQFEEMKKLISEIGVITDKYKDALSSNNS